MMLIVHGFHFLICVGEILFPLVQRQPPLKKPLLRAHHRLLLPLPQRTECDALKQADLVDISLVFLIFFLTLNMMLKN